jgi:hypothetical protein
MVRPIRTVEKADDPLVQRMCGLPDEVEVMLVGQCGPRQRPQEHVPPKYQHQRPQVDNQQRISAEASLAGAKLRHSMCLPSDNLERTTQCTIQSDGHFIMLTQRLEACGREGWRCVVLWPVLKRKSLQL